MGDPAYAAYLAALQYNQAQAEAQAAQRTDLVNQQLGLAIPGAQVQAQRQRVGVRGQMEDRGAYRSGETQRRLAESRSDEQRRIQGLRLTAAGDIAGVQGNLASQMGGYAQQASGQYLDALYRSILNQPAADPTPAVAAAGPAYAPAPGAPPAPDEPESSQYPRTRGYGGGGYTRY